MNCHYNYSPFFSHQLYSSTFPVSFDKIMSFNSLENFNHIQKYDEPPSILHLASTINNNYWSFASISTPLLFLPWITLKQIPDASFHSQIFQYISLKDKCSFIIPITLHLKLIIPWYNQICSHYSHFYNFLPFLQLRQNQNKVNT